MDNGEGNYGREERVNFSIDRREEAAERNNKEADPAPLKGRKVAGGTTLGERGKIKSHRSAPGRKKLNPIAESHQKPASEAEPTSRLGNLPRKEGGNEGKMNIPVDREGKKGYSSS